MNHPERRFQIVVADFLRACAPKNLIWFHIPNGENRSAATGGLLKRMGVRAGVPDFGFVLPDGRAAFIELKIAGKLSTDQGEFRNACFLVGAPWALCRSLDEVIENLEAWGVTTRVIV